MLTEKEIKQVHPEYSDMAPEWDYYWRSYIGGNEYREGAYLRKYLNEDAAPGDQYAIGARYQKPLSPAWIIRFDGMFGERENQENISGMRMELRRKF